MLPGGRMAARVIITRQCWNVGRFQKSDSYMPWYGGPQRPPPSSITTRRFSGSI